jgi:hypothetical protein
MAAITSSQRPGNSITDLPRANEATAMARWATLFEAGARSRPTILDGWAMYCMLISEIAEVRHFPLSLCLKNQGFD